MPKGRLILTPHPGEMARLLGMEETDAILADPIATVESMCPEGIGALIW